VPELRFDKSVYSATALKKASYRFMDRFSTSIHDEAGSYRVEVQFPKELSQESASHLLREFEKEVLDQDLREHIKKETESYRNLILAHTFSKTSLIEDE
jgi:His-Xaa-Ser system protein HxsD